jgi:hypothetical protein
MSNIIATGISAEVLKVLESQGLPIKTDLNVEMPDFPADITEVDDQELMSMAGRYMENINFLRTQSACASLAELEAENEYEARVAHGLLTNTTGKSTEKTAMLRASVITQPEIVELYKAKSFAHAYRKLLETNLENIERYYSLTSRELTRRTSNARNFTPSNRWTP